MQPDEKKRRKLYHRLKGQLFNGQLNKLLRELAGDAKALAPRPENIASLPAQSAARILWTHIQYIETYREHMDYPRYRLRGWPIARGPVEATCKRIGNRMKGANKRWTRAGAEAIAALIRDRARGDKRWESRWPPQILAA